MRNDHTIFRCYSSAIPNWEDHGLIENFVLRITGGNFPEGDGLKWQFLERSSGLFKDCNEPVEVKDALDLRNAQNNLSGDKRLVQEWRTGESIRLVEL